MTATVLVVEDSVLVVNALRLLLEARGYAVVSAGTVQEAVDEARRSAPDVMLLDLSLRGGSGLDVLAQLSAAGAHRPATIAVTGDDSPQVRARCLAAGCRNVVVKPISTTALPELIERALESRPGAP